MSRRDPAVALRQMLDHAREAVEMVRGKTRSDLDTDRKLNLAVVRLVELSVKLPAAFRRRSGSGIRESLGQTSSAFETAYSRIR